MKRVCLILGLVATIPICRAQIVTIPDANFKNALVNELVVDTDGDYFGDAVADTNNDGEIQVSEAEAVIGLNVAFFEINSLEGIQSFTNIEYLNCLDNNLTAIDVTQNLNLREFVCSDNELTSLDVSQNLDLILLQCEFNAITNLDVTVNADLNLLAIQYNLISTIDLSQNVNIEEFYCHGNLFQGIDLSQNVNLRRFSCWENQMISLDLSNNPNLEDVYCNDNQLVNLNIQNGNNEILDDLRVINNPNLECIQVDDENAEHPECNLTLLSGWCKDETATYSEQCELGTPDVSNTTIGLYPNPAYDILNIVNDSGDRLTSLKMYDQLGKLVIEELEQLDVIDVSGLSRGLYLAVLETEKSVTTRKIVIE